MIAIEQTFWQPTKPVSLNERGHWLTFQEPKRLWRDMGWATGMQLKSRLRHPFQAMPVPIPHHVTISMCHEMRTHVRRDGHNYSLTAKWFVDGLVKSGLLFDDSTQQLTLDDTTFRVVGGNLHKRKSIVYLRWEES